MTDTLLATPKRRTREVAATEPGQRRHAIGRRQWLVQRDGPFWDRGRVLELPASIHEGTLGRSFSCNWRLSDSSVSRLHAALVRKPRRGTYLVDLASREGTFVNGERVVGEILLMDGDRIRLGHRVVLEYLDGPPPEESEERLWVRRAWWALTGVGVGVVFLAGLLLF